MTKIAAGLVMCRLREEGAPELLLAHPGGPYFARKDDGAWTIPKGLVDEGEDLLEAARREFVEETGFAVDAQTFHPLGTIKQKNGKVVHGWAFAGDCDPSAVKSNDFEIEWPPRSGRRQRFPEVDRVEFFDLDAAKRKIIAAQQPLVERACGPEALAALFSER